MVIGKGITYSNLRNNRQIKEPPKATAKRSALSRLFNRIDVIKPTKPDRDLNRSAGFRSVEAFPPNQKLN